MILLHDLISLIRDFPGVLHILIGEGVVDEVVVVRGEEHAALDALGDPFLMQDGGGEVIAETQVEHGGFAGHAEVEAVVHYHLPADQTAYVHRVGRTGRWEADGCSYLILNPKETLPEYLDPTPEDYVPTQPARRPVAPRWVTVYIGRGKKDKLSRVDIVGFFCKKGGLRAADIGRIDVKDRYAYAAIDRLKVRAALRAVAGEKIKGMRTLVEVMRH